MMRMRIILSTATESHDTRSILLENYSIENSVSHDETLDKNTRKIIGGGENMRKALKWCIKVSILIAAVSGVSQAIQSKPDDPAYCRREGCPNFRVSSRDNGYPYTL